MKIIIIIIIAICERDRYFYDVNEITQKRMWLLLGEVMVDAGKVLELKARLPLSPLGAPLMRGRRADGVRSGKWYSCSWCIVNGPPAASYRMSKCFPVT